MWREKRWLQGLVDPPSYILTGLANLASLIENCGQIGRNIFGLLELISTLNTTSEPNFILFTQFNKLFHPPAALNYTQSKKMTKSVFYKEKKGPNIRCFYFNNGKISMKFICLIVWSVFIGFIMLIANKKNALTTLQTWPIFIIFPFFGKCWKCHDTPL